MKKQIVVATGNQNKLREIREIFSAYEIISQKEAGFDEEVEETGATSAENAQLKAEAAAKALNRPVLADDSGLCVDALGGAPGVYSARFAGEHGNDRANRALLLQKLEGESNRRAYFQCAVVLAYPDGSFVQAEGRTEGSILFEETGENGFGYDSVFYSDDLEDSFGVATAEEKNAVSHRSRALRKLAELLEDA